MKESLLGVPYLRDKSLTAAFVLILVSRAQWKRRVLKVENSLSIQHSREMERES